MQISQSKYVCSFWIATYSAFFSYRIEEEEEEKKVQKINCIYYARSKITSSQSQTYIHYWLHMWGVRILLLCFYSSHNSSGIWWRGWRARNVFFTFYAHIIQNQSQHKFTTNSIKCMNLQSIFRSSVDSLYCLSQRLMQIIWTTNEHIDIHCIVFSWLF